MAAPFIDGCALAQGCALWRLRFASGLHSQPLIKRILNRTQKKSSITRAGLSYDAYPAPIFPTISLIIGLNRRFHSWSLREVFAELTIIITACVVWE